MGLNVWSFTARLAADAETRFMANGDPIVNMRCAVDSGYGDKKTTLWVRCAMFGKRWEKVSPYLTKGCQVAVTGELSKDRFTGKDGVDVPSLEVRVNDLTLLGGKREGEQSPRESVPQNQQRSAPQGNGAFDDIEDQIPF